MTDFRMLEELLADYKPLDDSEAVGIKSLLQFLKASDNPYDRSNLFAHTVCDAWVVSPDRQRVLMLVHAENGHWLAPGGHADGSPDMQGAALRELLEETGIAPNQVKILLEGGLFDVNAGIVPERQKPHGLEPAHVHFDLGFAFEADPDQVKLQISDESLQLCWMPVQQALDKIMPCHRRRVRKTLDGFIS